MKNKLWIPTLLTLATTASVSMAQVCGGNTSSLNTAALEAPITITIPGGNMVPYQNVMARCQTYISSLENSLMLATRQAGVQGTQVALKTLTAALNAQAQLAAGTQITGYLPNTNEAILSGNRMVKAVVAQLNASKLGAKLTADVGWILTKGVVQVIQNVFYNIDTPYYQNSIQSCWQGCGPSNFSFEMEYIAAMGDVAQQFLDLQKQVATYLADDKVELVAAQQAVSAAKNMLLKSPLRRDYSCTIVELHNIEMNINSQLSCGGGVFGQDFQMVDFVRQSIDQINIPQYGCHGGYGYTPNRSRW